MPESEDIERAGRALIEAVPARAKVILFGTHDGDDGDDGSDIHLLVIERDVEDRFGGMAGLNSLFGHMLIPADVVVATEEDVRRRATVTGTVVDDALSHGRAIAES